jgi:arsenite-transporting ATPase
MTPDRMVVDEARRTATYLNLYGFLTDAVVVNRVLPEEAGPYFGAWRATQQAVLAEVREAFAPVPLLQAPWFGEEVVGPPALDRLGDALFAAHDPAAVLHDRLTHELVVGEDGATLRIDLPHTARGDVALRRVGDDLVLRVDGHKRVLALPSALADYAARSAALDDGVLRVTFDAPERAS